MIYKIQRLFSKNNNQTGNNNQQAQQENKITQPKPERTKRYKTVKEAELADSKQYLDDLAELNGHTASIDENGNRKTRSQIESEHNTRKENIDAYKRELNRKNRQQKIDKAKQKVKNAANKTKQLAKKNKKGLIIGSSILAAGTGAAIVGSKIYKKNKQNEIKKKVRGYSDVED